MTNNAFAGLDPCVHCGFCLQSCPTFLVTGDEADSPRGRIVLMQGLARGYLDPSDEHLTMHLDRCLGCRACEPVCPSGVAYGPALEHARHILSQSRAPSLLARLGLLAMGEPVVRRPLLGLLRLLRPVAGAVAGRSRIGFPLRMLAATHPSSQNHAPQRHGSIPAPQSGPLAVIFSGCVMSGLFQHVHDATARTLAINGYRIADAVGQGCCGALHAHAGAHEAAVSLARQNVRAFERVNADVIVVNSAGCGAQLREYGRLLAGDPDERSARRVGARVRDVSEALVARGPASGAKLERRVAYDPPCHLLHAQRIDEAPLSVLKAVPGLERVEHREAALCCGGAGMYALQQRTMSASVLQRKVSSLLSAAPDAVATGNPGCVMQIGAGLRAAGSSIPVVHPVELLDRSYDAAGLYD